jgi:E3 ubiquitin-protein ligase ZNF598
MGDSEQPVHAPISPENPTFHRDRRRGASGRGMLPPQKGSARGAGFRGGRSDRGTRVRAQSNHNRMPSSDGALGSSSGRPPGLSSDATNGAFAPNNSPQGQAKEVPETPSNASENAVDDSVEGDICFICASTIEHTAIAPCNHQTCHICSLRLRALYKTRACAHCRVSKALREPLNLANIISRPKPILLSSPMILRSGTNHFKTMNSPR